MMGKMKNNNHQTGGVNEDGISILVSSQRTKG